MKPSRTPVRFDDYDAEAAGYVDEDDYPIACESLDDMETLAAGRCLRPEPNGSVTPS